MSALKVKTSKKSVTHDTTIKDRLTVLEHITVGVDGDNGLRGISKDLIGRMKIIEEKLDDISDFVDNWKDNLKNLKRLMWLAAAALVSTIVANVVKVKVSEENRQTLQNVQTAIQDAVSPGQE